jgi:eukaryotic-like serine/threonine-protein kinase
MMSRHHTFCIKAIVLTHFSEISKAELRVPDKQPDKLWPDDPRVIGPYRLTGRLGRGGMGDVFLGRSAGGRSVAVKVIRSDFAADPEFRTRFRHEAAAARQVNGLYTAPVADADVDGPMPWLATAYVPGPSLASAVERYGPLPPRSVLALAAGLAEGVAAIHAVGLVHRDLKPSNVLLAADGPRVIDFGIARFTASTGITRVGVVVGSPEYMSPEQAAGRVIGPPSDVFSLGAVLAYAAAGHVPFAGEDASAVFDHIAFSRPDLSGVPAELRPMIEWCMAKAPQDRPTPQQLLASLGETPRLWDDWLPASLLADLPGSRRPPVRAARGRAPARQPGATRNDDTITTLSPVSGPADLPTESREQAGRPRPTGRAAGQPDAGQSPRRSSRARRRPRAWLIATPVTLAVLAAAGVGIGLALSNGGNGTAPRPTDSASASHLPALGPASTVRYRFAVVGATAGGCVTARASVPGGRLIAVDFTDKATAKLAVDWLNYHGARQRYFVLKPGETREVHAYVGDAWLITDGHGCVGTFTSTQSSHITVQSPAPAEPEKTATPTTKPAAKTTKKG